MAEGEPDYVTLHEYYKHRQRQDDDIRKAFESQAALIESSNQQLRDDLNATFNNRLSSVNGALGGKLKGLQDELGKVKQDLRHLKDEVGQVKDEVGQVKDEVGQVKDEVGEIKARLNQMEGRSFNKSRLLPWHNISTIGIYKPELGFTLPEYFPSTIKQFWNLQLPSQEKNLIYLLRFYDIQSYRQWDQADDIYDPANDMDECSSSESDSQSISGESDDSSRRILSLEEAVRKHTRTAIDELGSHIGLNLELIRSYFDRTAKQYQIQSNPTKRRLAADAPKIEAVKRVRNEEPQSSLIPLNLPARPLVKSPTRSLSDRVMWDVSANERAHADLMAKMHAAKSVSKESTTDPIPSSHPRDLGGSKKGSTKGL